MDKINDGGPAFPSKKRIYRAGYPTDDFEPVGGMSLRDYFAAKAMQGLLAQSLGTALESDHILGAQYAYRVADAMIAAREKQP